MARRPTAALLALAACGGGAELAPPATADHEPIEPCVASAPDPDPATGDRYPERLETVSGAVVRPVAPGFAWAHSRGFLRASPAQGWAALGASAPCALGSLPGEGRAGRWARGPLEGPAAALQVVGARYQRLGGPLRAASIALRPVEPVVAAGVLEVEIVVHLEGAEARPSEAADGSSRIFACLAAEQLPEADRDARALDARRPRGHAHLE